MKRVFPTLPRRRPLAVLIATAFACQVGVAQEQPGGQVLNNAASFTAAPPRSGEREGREFDALGASGLGIQERRRMLQAVAPAGLPTQQASLQDTVDGTNFESGRAVLLPKARGTLDALAARLRGKRALRLEVVGHTDNQGIAARLRPVYPDNQALSEARALAVAAYLQTSLGLESGAIAANGRADREPVAGNDTPEGMARNRRTEIRAWFEEVMQEAAAAPATPQTLETVVVRDACAPAAKAGKGGQPFSISVDGEPLDLDSAQQEADRQRCVDVALERADIQLRYDPLEVVPALNVWLAQDAAVRGAPVRFATYTNYAWWLRRAEIRVFAAGQDSRETPLAVVPVTPGAQAEWQAPGDAPEALVYLLRVYDAEGRFDETAPRKLALLEGAPVGVPKERRYDGWGENTRHLQNIRAAGGSVTVSGEGIAPTQHVEALGVPVPVDAKGAFALRQILPAGAHAVAVSVRDADGTGSTFKRNLAIADRDWFYVAVADLTAGRDRTSGPAKLVTGDTQHYDNGNWIDGRAAFYVKGKVRGDMLLTASADTREGPLRDLFSNFSSKDPRYLLRNIEPDKFYPVYGDDSTIADDAPTSGKLYVRLARQDSSIMWGNFQTAWTGTELAQFSRGLYGAKLDWQSADATTSGERSSRVSVFAAEPGTLPAREEFRGTGGSLYYLRHQDLTQGSERVWVEVRDRDSGMVLNRSALTPSQDYEISYLQGRVTLRAPLSSIAEARSLLQQGGRSGDPVHLVVTYEYVPGLTRIGGGAAGVRAENWFGEHLKLGVSAYHQGERESTQDLKALDATVRYTPNTWVALEAARSDGAGSQTYSSLSGGFDFERQQGAGGRAGARRVEAKADLADVGLRGQLKGYWQDREAGFSGPGQVAFNGEATRQQGVSVSVPLGQRSEVAVKADERNAFSQDQRAAEAALRHKLDPEWGVSAAVRHDRRDNLAGANTPTASPLLNQQGGRSDAVLRIDYRPLALDGELANTPMAAPGAGARRRSADAEAAAGIAAAPEAGRAYRDWNLYGFVQRTLAHDLGRSENDRVGAGGAWQASNALRLGAEVSGGSGGAGGELSANYRASDRSDVYLAYALETENPDVNYAGRQGTFTGGSRYRVSEGASLFGETRRQDGSGPRSLVHAFGVDLAPAEHWTVGAKAEVGTLSDPFAGDLRRRAVGVSASFRDARWRFTTALEYRFDRSAAVVAGEGASVASGDTRRSWVTRNSLGLQVDADWRLLGKLNVARSTASQGAFYDGDYTEAVLGAAWRPVAHDRWNGLFKYTYFHNLPSSGQVDNVTSGVLDYMQKSHVLNLDVTHDLRPWLAVGAKYGLRTGQLKTTRGEGEWFDSRAHLTVLRADLKFTREWSGVVEARRLAAKEAGDARKGALVGLYRQAGQHAKIGVGYNFTDFSDELTDLSYRSRGWFINAVGTF
ncbi:OmpA family protein [Massilia sp. G4R7]|uniref:OmpA family protein n=1 Tax=Massilia phyllostachyos TaxID=2898585 RepID=A0ABS8Q397_9BURK|nr:OmpA family protein [Massilia phyllostachyos]MCD2516210.1 OmpA family protein [Massilia phyllostachyos]